MDELFRAFALGNAAILTNACLLPLYPGLIAFLAGNANNEQSRRATGWLGVLVLAGILTMMTLIGLVLFLLQQSFGDALTLLLPLIYAIVIGLGIMMVMGRNPFAKLATVQSPMLRNPYITAYIYGLLFGPMTLPCTGPIILSAFALGANNTGELINGLLYFLAFGLGFGWPLALLPLAALSVQKRLVRTLASNHLLLTRISGILLIAVGLFGILTELLPRYVAIEDFTLAPEVWVFYWLFVAVLATGVGVYTRARRTASDALTTPAP
jgi:cytochrome c-type biogenesis protein